MVDVLEEVTTDTLTRDHVVERVEDWRSRIDALYRDIVDWLPEEWRSQQNRRRVMHEELMREFGVPPRDLPILDLESENGRRSTIEPRGLWIIGANGRLDLTGPGVHFVITDGAEILAPSLWQIAPFRSRLDRKQFDRASLLHALRA